MPKKKSNVSVTIRVLQDLWLSDSEAAVYMLLLESPKLTVQQVVTKTPFTRTMLYYVLKKLEEKSLIYSRKEKWKTVFIAENPEKLYDILEKQEVEFEKQKLSIRELIPQLKQSYNLKTKRPTVKTFEWIEAYEKILEDSLLSNTGEIYVFENLVSWKPAVESRENYERKRVLRKIQKKVLFFESPESLKCLAQIPYNDYTQFRSFQQGITPFFTDVMLYSWKVLYTSLSWQYEPIAILIEDENLYQMQKNIFENFWKLSRDRTLYFTQTNKK